VPSTASLMPGMRWLRRSQTGDMSHSSRRVVFRKNLNFTCVSQAMLRATGWAHARIVAGVPDTPPFLCMQRSREPSLGLVRKGLETSPSHGKNLPT
jgi:hypothetical protein